MTFYRGRFSPEFEPESSIVHQPKFDQSKGRAGRPKCVPCRAARARNADQLYSGITKTMRMIYAILHDSDLGPTVTVLSQPESESRGRHRPGARAAR
jgi:hypothetical protein